MDFKPQSAEQRGDYFLFHNVKLEGLEALEQRGKDRKTLLSHVNNRAVIKCEAETVPVK